MRKFPLSPAEILRESAWTQVRENSPSSLFWSVNWKQKPLICPVNTRHSVPNTLPNFISLCLPSLIWNWQVLFSSSRMSEWTFAQLLIGFEWTWWPDASFFNVKLGFYGSSCLQELKLLLETVKNKNSVITSVIQNMWGNETRQANNLLLYLISLQRRLKSSCQWKHSQENQMFK